MDTLPQRNESDVELDLHHLQVFDVLLTEHSQTKAARLRLYFGDPLFVRVALRMEPTPKALELADPVRAILKGLRALRSEHASFDPKTSTRKFSFFLVDAGVVKIFPTLLNYLAAEAPGICVQSIPCDAQHLDLWLESAGINNTVESNALRLRRRMLTARQGRRSDDRHNYDSLHGFSINLVVLVY